MDRLTPLERRVLDFEEAHPRLRGARKSVAVQAQLGMGNIRYHQVLAGLLDRKAAEAYAPGTVHRLRKTVADREGRLAG